MGERIAFVRPRVHPERIAEACDRFIEAERRTRRDRDLADAERKLGRAVATAFRRQSGAFLRRFRSLDSTTRPPAWEPMFDEAARETRGAFTVPLMRHLSDALRKGVRSAGADLDVTFRLGSLFEARIREQLQGEIDPTWNVSPDDAVRWLAAHAGEAVTQIDETTRHGLALIIRDGTEAGLSIGQMATMIAENFDDMTRDRALVIAQYETASAYAEGQRLSTQALVDAGIPMRKAWLTAGDERVDPDCVSNEGAGWIAWQEGFPTGHDSPPAHPRCRCDIQVEPDFEGTTRR